MAMASAGEVGFDANNPCLALDDMLGPFLPGNPIDDLLNGLISGFLTLAGSLLGAIIGTLANLLGSIISGIVGMISGIIGALTSFFSSVLELIDVNVAMTLEGLFMDPCLNYMMRKSGMVTPPVLNNLIASVTNMKKSQPGVGVWVYPNGTSLPLSEPPSGN